MSRSDEPVYSHGDRQIARILHRAAELQEQDTERSGASRERAAGVSLTELKQIAGEVGIDPRYVETAATEIQEGSEGQPGFYFWGAPVSSTLERVVEGEVSPDEWEVLIARIREVTGRVGKPSTLGRSLEWISQNDHLSVRPKDGRTTIRIMSRYADTMVLAHMPAFWGSVFLNILIAASLHGAPLEAVGLGAAVTGGVFVLARRWAGSMVRGHRSKMKALLQELANDVEQTARHASTERISLETERSEKASVPTEDPLTVSRPPGA
jgi:hypothetical protein